MTVHDNGEGDMARMAPVGALRGCRCLNIDWKRGVGVYTELLGSASARNASLYIEFVHGCPGAKASDMRLAGQPN